MSISNRRSWLSTAGLAAVLLTVAACTTAIRPDGADTLREQLTALQSDPYLGSRATVAMKEAEEAVQLAEEPTDDPAVGGQRLYVAKRKVEIARALAEKEYAESQRPMLEEQRAAARLAARTAEAETAKAEANAAQRKAQVVSAENEALRAHMAELEARETARGYVMTLGGVLFATGRADLTPGAAERLEKLADFMHKAPRQRLIIEGHTDDVGSDANNLALSERRAEAVRAFLISRGVAADRITAVGKGESTPVADNSTSAGRQQNRRVEVVIAS